MRRQPRDDGRKAREETKQITVVAVAAAVVVVAGTSLSLSRPPFPAFNAFDKHRNSIMQFFCFDDENLPRVFSRLCSLSLSLIAFSHRICLRVRETQVNAVHVMWPGGRASTSLVSLSPLKGWTRKDGKNEK